MDNLEKPSDPVTNYQKRCNIIDNTPSGQDPVIYWHQVAQDAIHARLQQEETVKKLKAEVSKLINQLHIQTISAPNGYEELPSFDNLLNRVRNGHFSMNVQLSFYPIENGGDNNETR